MKKSIFKLILFSILPFSVVVFSIYLMGKHSDNMYKRFITPPQNSFILGSSRAASIDPEIIDKIIEKKFPKVKLFNYAFTWSHSPYGPKYLESIKKKLLPNSKNGLFIVTVEPTALMVDKNEPDELEFYVENDKSVAKTSQVNWNPNLEYLVESYDFSITNEINKKIRPEKNPMATVEILNNGKIDVTPIKSFATEKQAESNRIKMQEFEVKMSHLKKSEKRLNYLAQTIDFLQQHGKVIVIRTPIAKTPYQIENKHYTDFDEKIKEICEKKRINYLNYNLTENNYRYYDEVHLHKLSMIKFSKVLAEDIFNRF